MISIEAYRASVGRFYDKSKRLSNIDEFNTNMSCFFSAYLNYLVLEFYDFSFLKRFKLLMAMLSLILDLLLRVMLIKHPKEEKRNANLSISLLRN